MQAASLFFAAHVIAEVATNSASACRHTAQSYSSDHFEELKHPMRLGEMHRGCPIHYRLFQLIDWMRNAAKCAPGGLLRAKLRWGSSLVPPTFFIMTKRAFPELTTRESSRQNSQYSHCGPKFNFLISTNNYGRDPREVGAGNIWKHIEQVKKCIQKTSSEKSFDKFDLENWVHFGSWACKIKTLSCV